MGPSRFVSPGGELPLSGLGQLELLRAMVERGLALRTSVYGFSMKPLIRDGDVVTIAPLAGRDPGIGDVVAFVLPGAEKLALHRVVSSRQGGWLLRGDNSLESDGVVAPDRILGRVVRVERGGRDVGFGTGLAGAGVAWLSRSGVLGLLRSARRSVRRVTWPALEHMQGLAVYRAAGRRLAPRFYIDEATGADLRMAQHRFGFIAAEPLLSEEARPGVTDWVAKRGRRVVGFVQLVVGKDPDSPWAGHWLFSLMVKGRYRGLGLGEALTSRVIGEAQAQGAASLFLVVYGDNKRAISLFRKLGFAPVPVEALEPGLEAEQQLSGRRRIVMRKGLGAGAV